MELFLFTLNKLGKCYIYRKKYENILLMGDYNVDVKETNMKVFYNQHKLKALDEEPICFKNFGNSSCTDLFLTNSSKSFENASIWRQVCQISISS